jgi:hypothetical protein
MRQTWQQSLINAQVAGAALSNSAAATSILPSQAKFVMPANYLNDIGSSFAIRAFGQVSNIVTTPGTLTLDWRLGGTVVWSSGAMQLSTTAHTNVPWKLEVDLVLRVSGASAQFLSQGIFFSQAASISGADPTTGHSFLLAPNTAPALSTAFDATTGQQCDLFATFSIANSGNALTLQMYRLDSLN